MWILSQYQNNILLPSPTPIWSMAKYVYVIGMVFNWSYEDMEGTVLGTCGHFANPHFIKYDRCRLYSMSYLIKWSTKKDRVQKCPKNWRSHITRYLRTVCELFCIFTWPLLVDNGHNWKLDTEYLNVQSDLSGSVYLFINHFLSFWFFEVFATSRYLRTVCELHCIFTWPLLVDIIENWTQSIWAVAEKAQLKRRLFGHFFHFECLLTKDRIGLECLVSSQPFFWQAQLCQ